MTVFIDDINMPIINEWGDQVSLIHTLLHHHTHLFMGKPSDIVPIVYTCVHSKTRCLLMSDFVKA